MKKSELRALIQEQVRKVLKEALIGPFSFDANTPDEELIAMYHGALDGFSNYKPGMHFKRTDYRMAYQAIEKLLKQKGIAITESKLTEADMTRNYDGFKVLNSKTKKLTKFRYVKGRKSTDVENDAFRTLSKATGLPTSYFMVHGFVRKGDYATDKDPEFVKESVKLKEAKEYSFTFDYNTDPDDIEYIENLLKKARVNAYAEQGTFDDEMVIKAGDAIELRKAKKAIEADGFQINEAILNAPEQKEWPLKFNINYDDLPANLDLRTASLNKLFQGIPYQHLAWPEVSDDGAFIFKTAEDLAKAKQVLGLKESKINEDAGMVVDVAMGVAAGLMGLWALVQGAPAVQRLFGDAADYLADKAEKKARAALKNQRKETIAPIIAKFKNDQKLADMYQALPPYDVIRGRDFNGRRKALTAIGKYIKSKLTAEEMQYFTDVSAMLRDGDLK